MEPRNVVLGALVGALLAIAGCASGGARPDSGHGGSRDGGGPGTDSGAPEDGGPDRDGGGIALDGGPVGSDSGPTTCTMSCDDGDPCTTDGCTAGACVHAPLTCDDGDACTSDACTATGACSHVRPTVTGDTCSSPIDVSAGGMFAGTSTCAASDAAGGCGAGDAPDVFFRLVLASASNVTIDAAGTSFDSVLALGTSCTGGELGCDDSTSGDDGRLVRSALAAGTYSVILDGKPGGTGGAWQISVAITPVATPQTVTFPTSTDTMSPDHGYLWELGSFVQGSRATSVGSITSADMSLVPVENVLTCDSQDMRLMINGTEVGRFSVPAGGSVAAITRSFTFPAIAGPTYTFRYENVRAVAGGCGSARFGDSTPASTITIRP